MLPKTKSFLILGDSSVLQLIRSNPHGWVVVTVCFFALSVVSATRASIGLVMPSLEADFGWSRGFISSVAAWALVTMAITAPIVGNLLDRYGARIILTVGLFVAGIGLCSSAIIETQWQFLLSFALLAGIGYGTVAKSIVSATIVLYFEKNRGLATGFAAAGSTAGQLALLPTLAFVLTAMGWRYGYVFLGISCLVFIPFVWFLIGDAKRQPKIKDKSASPTLGLGQRLGFLFRNRTFVLLLGSYTICGFTTAGVIETHLIPYVQSCGIPIVTGATAYGVLAGFNMLGMALAGYLADKMHRPLLLGTIYAMRGLSFILLMMVPAYDVPALFLFAVMFGIFDYSTIPATTSLIASHVGLRVMGLALGMLGMFHSAGAAAGAFLGGVLYDMFQQYTWVWVASVALALLAAVMAYAIKEKPDESQRLETQGAPTTA